MSRRGLIAQGLALGLLLVVTPSPRDVAAATELPRLPSARAPLSAEDRAKQERLSLLDLDRKKLQRKMILRSRSARLLQAAVTKIDEEDPAEALEILSGLKTDRLNPFEAARTYLIRAHAAYANGDPASAVDNFRKAIAEEALLIPEEAGLRFNVAQLLAAQQMWPEVIDAIHEWSEYTIEKKPIAHYLLAVSYFQIEQPERALAEAETAVRLSESPKEGWLGLLAALYVAHERYDEAIPVFEELVTYYPKKLYWEQLSLLWGARENYRHALAVQQIAYEQGLVDDQKGIERLSRAYLYHELPYPAASVLQKGIDDGIVDPDVTMLELLANSWIAAREYEKSLGPLTQAAEMSENGDLLVRLAQVYMQREDWEKGSELLERAIERGGLKDAGNAQLLLGICYYNDARLEPARSSFARAAQDERVRPAAQGWITHIDREAAASGGTLSGTGG